MKFEDTRAWWDWKDNVLDKETPDLQVRVLEIFHSLFPSFHSDMLLESARIERILASCGCSFVRLALVHEWITLSTLETLRAGPRNRLTNDLIRLGALTYNVTRTIGGIYSHSAIALEGCGDTTPQHRQTLFHELLRYSQELGERVLNDDMLESLREELKHVEAGHGFVDVTFGSDIPDEYAFFPLFVEHSYSNNFIDDDGQFQDDSMFSFLKRPYTQRVRVVSESLSNQTDCIVFIVQLPVNFLYHLHDGRKIARTFCIAFARIEVMGPRLKGRSKMCDATLFERIEVHGLEKVHVPVLNVWGQILTILGPTEGTDHASLHLAGYLMVWLCHAQGLNLDLLFRSDVSSHPLLSKFQSLVDDTFSELSSPPPSRMSSNHRRVRTSNWMKVVPFVLAQKRVHETNSETKMVASQNVIYQFNDGLFAHPATAFRTNLLVTLRRCVDAFQASDLLEEMSFHDVDFISPVIVEDTRY